MKLSDYRLGAKLGAAFAAVILLAASLGGFSLVQLGKLNANTADLAVQWLPSVQVLGELQDIVADLHGSHARHVIARDAAEMTAIESQLVQTRQRLAAKQKQYQPLINSAEEKRDYEGLKTRIDAYLAAGDKLLALSRGGEPALAQTKDFFGGESHQAYTALREDVAKLVAVNNKGADAAHLAAQSTYSQARIGVIAGVMGSTLLGIVLAGWFTRLVTRPLAQAVGAAERIAGGDLTVPLVAAGKDETAQLLRTLSAMQDKLVRIVNGVRHNADSVAAASAEISQGNSNLSTRTEEQASALEETAAAMEQLSATVRQNADNARQANQLALGASTVAVKGGDVVGHVIDTMKSINDSSGQIAEIVSVIDGIAFQTNILALNAAVEAARAGDQGRGFAVVASEVRSLAGRSADAAKEIKALIAASVERVRQGSAQVDLAGATMAEVVTSIQRVTDIMGEISAASAEQSSGVAQVGEAITQMDQATQQNAALVEASAAAAESLSVQARQLVKTVSVFTLAGHTAAVTPSLKPKPRPMVASVAIERRGPNRATNVARPAFGATRIATSSAQAETGTSREWTSF